MEKEKEKDRPVHQKEAGAYQGAAAAAAASSVAAGKEVLDQQATAVAGERVDFVGLKLLSRHDELPPFNSWDAN